MSTDNIQAFRDWVLELLNYDPVSGIFTWKVSRGGTKAGSIAGTPREGYVMISVDRKNYRAHRLAYLIMMGNNPTHEIDHRDRSRSNNAYSNLREATGSQNSANRSKRENTTSCYIGVSWNKTKSKWVAYVNKDRVRHRLGYFDDPKEAAIACDKAAIKLHGEFSRLNFRYTVDEEGNVETDE